MKRATTKTSKNKLTLAEATETIAEYARLIQELRESLVESESCLTASEDRRLVALAANEALQEKFERLWEEKDFLLRESWWACTARKINECWVQFVK